MSILAFRKITVASGFSKSTCSLRAVKTMQPVSSPTRHSAMRGAREEAAAGAPGRTRPGTGVALTTLTVRVWPLVPGLSWSTLMKTGFRSAGFSPPCAAAVDIAGGGGGGSDRGWGFAGGDCGNPSVWVGEVEC
uniref:Uncharacterized protein n=1 Tax=Arundo donax TaxID=35708 RepID=A0A0A9GMI6_ARUDO